jgi:hypothetical protein
MHFQKEKYPHFSIWIQELSAYIVF